MSTGLGRNRRRPLRGRRDVELCLVMLEFWSADTTRTCNTYAVRDIAHNDPLLVRKTSTVPEDPDGTSEFLQLHVLLTGKRRRVTYYVSRTPLFVFR
eukprot:1178196-Prorocentrum_minimum.AAC.3